MGGEGLGEGGGGGGGDGPSGLGFLGDGGCLSGYTVVGGG